MKPFKAGVPLAKWLLRLSLFIFLLLLYSSTFLAFNIKSLSFFIAATYLVLGILLILGGLLSKPSLTVISGLLLFILSVYQLVVLFDGGLSITWFTHALPASIGFYFFCRGNMG